MDADLLANDRAQKGEVAPLAGARLGISGMPERRAKGRLAAGKLVQRRPELFARYSHFHPALELERAA
jgi:hypothetical protein